MSAAAAETPETVLAAEASQQTEATTSAEEPARRKPFTFRVLASVVLAAKRFQAAINPTYEYGISKRQKVYPPGESAPDAAARKLMRMPSPPVRYTATGAEMRGSDKRFAISHHGNRASLLMARLPDVTPIGS